MTQPSNCDLRLSDQPVTKSESRSCVLFIQISLSNDARLMNVHLCNRVSVLNCTLHPQHGGTALVRATEHRHTPKTS